MISWRVEDDGENFDVDKFGRREDWPSYETALMSLLSDKFLLCKVPLNYIGIVLLLTSLTDKFLAFFLFLVGIFS